MQLFFVGLNHRTAPVEIRECLAVPPHEMEGFLLQIADSARRESPIAEVAIISTCNRFEVYGLAEDCPQASAHLCAALSRLRGVPLEKFSPHLVYGYDEDVVRHLCSVAAGLDSMILGEPQILGQVADAHQCAVGCAATGPVLDALFRKSIECGKRARRETAISEHAVSVSHVAVELAKQIFGSLANQCVLLIGAGEMAELAARNLADNGAGRILVVNRSRGRAERLARQFGGTAYGWDEIGMALMRADIVVCSAAAPHAVIHPETLHRVMALRRQQPLFLIDIAVPRNVEPDVRKIPNVYLYDIDDLQSVVQTNLAHREREVPRVQAIVHESTAEFMAWVRSLDVAETIHDLRSMAEQIRDDEIARALRRLGPLDEREEQIVRVLGHRIVSKLLHWPTVRLKEFAENGDGHRYADALRDLFGLAEVRGGQGHG